LQLEGEYSAVDEQLQELWATALRAQESLWVSLAARSLADLAAGAGAGASAGPDSLSASAIGLSLGQVEEEIMSSTVLHRLVTEAKLSAAEGLIRLDMFPESCRGEGSAEADTGMDTSASGAGAGAGADGFTLGGVDLDAVLNRSGVLSGKAAEDALKELLGRRATAGSTAASSTVYSDILHQRIAFLIRSCIGA
jgi:hypothetical protein